jgi:hypothetical protein
MSTLADLRPGDIMFARHVRPRAADLLILAGQTLLGQPGYPHHVAVVTRAETPFLWPKIVQAMPSGAEEIEIGQEHWTGDYVYLRPAYIPRDPLGEQGHIDWIGQAETVTNVARHYIGTPYSFLDYAALAGWHFGVRNGLIRRYVKSSGHQICSQLADQAMSDAGFHVFDDGRLPQDVTPAALYEKLLAMPGTLVLHPGDKDEGWFPESS